MEIAKRLNAIIAQLLPFLSQEVDIYNIYSIHICNLPVLSTDVFLSSTSSKW